MASVSHLIILHYITTYSLSLNHSTEILISTFPHFNIRFTLNQHFINVNDDYSFSHGFIRLRFSFPEN